MATALGYLHLEKAIWKHVWKDYKTTFAELQRSPNLGDLESSQNKDLSFHPHTVFVEEPGVYPLIFFSKLPSAVKFQRCVFEEVLPSIRKIGTYTLPNKYNTIKSITNEVFAGGDECELKEYHKFLKSQCELVTKDQSKVEMERLGGLKTQQNIREIISKIGELGSELDLESERCKRLEPENKELKAVITAVSNITSMVGSPV